MPASIHLNRLGSGGGGCNNDLPVKGLLSGKSIGRALWVN